MAKKVNYCERCLNMNRVDVTATHVIAVKETIYSDLSSTNPTVKPARDVFKTLVVCTPHLVVAQQVDGGAGLLATQKL